MTHHHRIATAHERVEEKIVNNIEFREQFYKNKHAVAEWKAKLEREAKVAKAKQLGTARIEGAQAIKAAMNLETKEREQFWINFSNKRFEEV